VADGGVRSGSSDSAPTDWIWRRSQLWPGSASGVGSVPYDRRMPGLVAPTSRLRSSWRAAHQEWGPGIHEDGFGLLADDDVSTAQGFRAWIRRLSEESDPATRPDGGRIHCTYRWVTDDDQVLGGIALRHELDDPLIAERGHIGFGIRPSARGRGLAAWALGQMLAEAATLGLDRVLVVCAVDNRPSARTIERCGGVQENIRPTGGETLRRYWIPTDRDISGDCHADPEHRVGSRSWPPGAPGRSVRGSGDHGGGREGRQRDIPA